MYVTKEKLWHIKDKQWHITTKYRHGLPIIWRPGYALPSRFTTMLDGEHLPYRVELDLVASAGGVDVRAITFRAFDGGEPIGARRLRDVPVAECVGIAIAVAVMRSTKQGNQLIVEPGASDEIGQQLELARASDPRTSDAHLRAVADVYLAASEKPTQAVEQYFGPISHSTAARWVGEARRRGFLPPYKKSKKPTKEERR